ncbi:4-oxalocrotonate tautomerase [Pandoraea vervacti]|uniref:4-oxalocrotonate tautomerase n=2 Tax=Pandoraea TaxID=93217 RepID=A0A5E5AF17_9BURK|nr:MULTISPECIES: 4-oxalocrotonate tautomerase family protein [Pandoraea]AJP58488.1 4-oxalocrotonate tautomerase [Pandoraea vervacti]VVE72209.1 4-oxalocrotonate tautomerase [Pandoraea captiosa]
MPHIVLQLSGTPDDTLSRQAVRAVSQLTVDTLHKAPEVIAVTVDYIPHERWFIGGAPLSEQGKNAFHLDISVTDETNTKAEKARFIAQVFETLSGILGNVHECSYIHVIDARAAAYGYGGRTQEYRHQRAPAL